MTNPAPVTAYAAVSPDGKLIADSVNNSAIELQSILDFEAELAGGPKNRFTLPVTILPTADYEALVARADAVQVWQPIVTAPTGEDVLVWYDHGADPYHDPQNPSRLTDYAAWADGGNFLDGKGVTVARRCPQHWESTDEYGDGYWLPAAWFSRGDFGG